MIAFWAGRADRLAELATTGASSAELSSVAEVDGARSSRLDLLMAASLLMEVDDDATGARASAVELSLSGVEGDEISNHLSQRILKHYTDLLRVVVVGRRRSLHSLLLMHVSLQHCLQRGGEGVCLQHHPRQTHQYPSCLQQHCFLLCLKSL